MFRLRRGVRSRSVQTNMKGNIAEAAILNAFVERDLRILVPFGGGHPYDLVVHLRMDRFLRVQCKSARLLEGCVTFNSRTTDHGRGRRPYLGLADAFGVYFSPSRAVYLVPVCEVLTFQVRLRLQPARNNQRQGVQLAADYEIERWTFERLCQIATAPSESPESPLRLVPRVDKPNRADH
jgi:PD-(D/E)XK endonuclease